MTDADRDAAAWAALDDEALIERLADAARVAATPWFRRADLAAANKAAEGFDPVTEADRAVERTIRAILALARPDDAVLGEEYGETLGAADGRRWVIDPIDGTRAFLCGLLNWGVLIALDDGGGPSLGVLDQPYVGERFIGRSGANARWARCGRPGAAPTAIHVRPCARIEDAVLLTTSPDLFKPGREADGFAQLKARARLTRYGTDCYGYAMVAAGCADVVLETGLAPYDIQALIPIIEGAGGVVTTWDGGSAADGGRVLAAGDPALHEAALALLSAA